MFVLDTNVLSEIMAFGGAPSVMAWVDSVRRSDLFTTALNQAEILFGIAVMPNGRKRTRLIAAADAMFAEDFRGRILAFDERAAGHFADIAANRRRIGRDIQPVDAQIAAIVRAQGMAVATRDVGGFEYCGIEIVNPWSL